MGEDNNINPSTNRRKYLAGVAGTVATPAFTGAASASHGGKHTITIVAATSETSYYRFTTTGTVEQTTDYGGTINEFDSINESTVIGRTTREPDTYLLDEDAEITDFRTDAPIYVYINGAPVEDAEEPEGNEKIKAEAEATPDSEAPSEQSESESDGEDSEDTAEESSDDEQVDESDYSEVINLADEGADLSGSDSVVSLIKDVIGDDTLLRFPEGTYLVDSQIRVVNYDNLGLVGNNATIKVAPTDSYVFKLGTYRSPIGSLHVEGFTADISSSNTGGRVFECQAETDLYVGNVTIDGKHDTPSKGPLLAGLSSSDGEGTVENYRSPDGGEDVSGGNGGTGLLVSHYNEGTLTVRNCEIGPFPDNGIYCSNAEGTVHVEGGICRNTNVAGVRLSGDNSAIDGTEFVYDEEIPGFGGQRAIRLDSGSGLSVSNVDITMDVEITEAIRVMSGVESATFSNITMDLTSAVRDGISLVGSTDIDTSNLSISGQSRNEIFRY